MPYPINQRAHQVNSIQSVPVSFGLWDTALKFPSPVPRSDVTDHLDLIYPGKKCFCRDMKKISKKFHQGALTILSIITSMTIENRAL